MNKFSGFFLDIYRKRSILYELVKRNFQKQYMGSYLGILWVYLQPLLFIIVIYLIFSLGLKGGGLQNDIPFVVYLITGIVPWFYISDNLSSNTRVIKQHSYLLKKVDFRLSMLPLVNILTAVVSHVFLIFVSIIVILMNDIVLSFYVFQIIYYFLCMICFLLGIAWLTSATQLFIPDTAKFISLVITFGFWLTPIFWNISNIPEKFKWLIFFNPFAYIVQGYRDSLYLEIGFWEKPQETFFFWLITSFFLVVGITVFKKLRPHFAEVA